MIRKYLPIVLAVLLGSAVAGFVSGCSDIKMEPPGDPMSPQELRKRNFGKLFGDDALRLGGPANPLDRGGASPIGVNSFLWRASLDTISFMPLASADPFGGVIITDWYAPPESQGERFKLNIYILGNDLRADGVRAAVFRQLRERQGTWADAPVDEQTATDLENAILTRARQLRIASLR